MLYFRTKYPIRADQVSMKVFNSVEYTQDILRLNPNLTTLSVIPTDTLIKLPKEKEAEQKGVNLWS